MKTFFVFCFSFHSSVLKDTKTNIYWLFWSCETERKEACGRRKHEPEREAAGRETKQSCLARTEAARWLSARAAE